MSDILHRAYNPRVGDRFAKDDGTVILEVLLIAEALNSLFVVYSVPHITAKRQTVELWFYQKIVQSNLKYEFRFLAVEDDEE